MKTRRFLLTIFFIGLAYVPPKFFAQSGAGPRIRENFNAGWLFARQARGMGELGSFDRENGDAGQIESRFRDAEKLGYDDSSWQPMNTAAYLERPRRDG